MGFGIKELEQLSNIMTHIASINKIDKVILIQKFLKDVASQYDSMLGFEAAINLLNEEKVKIENEIPAYRAFINTKVAATQSIDYLQERGVTVFDIIGISLMMKAFLSGKFASYPSKFTNAVNMQGNKTENNNIKSWQTFIDYLKNLKDWMIELEAKRIELNNIKTQIDTKLVERQQIDSQLINSTSKLNDLTTQGINFMNTINQFNTCLHTNMTTTKILPMVFVNIPSPTDSQASESLDSHESEEQAE